MLARDEGGMVRIALRQFAAAFAALAALFAIASPAAAQSFGLVYLPVQPAVAWQAQVQVAAVAAHQPAAMIEHSHPRITAQPILFAAAPQDLPQWQPQPSQASQRFVETHRPQATFGQRAVTRRDYGPFRVIDGHTVELLGETDARSPDHFAQLLSDYPGVARIDMVECPGTLDDRANLRLGRMIRAAGIATHVPEYGSVRSGAVELFLAGANRSIANGAEFAVHSWRDEQGREADDFSMDAPQNRTYLDYYREMGMSGAQAMDFYRMTNSVPHHRARWLGAREMRRWVGGRREAAQVARAPQQGNPRLAYISFEGP